MAYVRLLQSAVEPAEVEVLLEAFRDDMLPVFEKLPDCEAIELLVAPEPNAGGLVDTCILSRWKTLDAMETATAEAREKGTNDRVRARLRQEPVVRVFQVLD